MYRSYDPDFNIKNPLYFNPMELNESSRRLFLKQALALSAMAAVPAVITKSVSANGMPV